MKNRADFLPLILRMMEYSSGQETGLKSPLRAKNGKPEIFVSGSLLLILISSS